MSPEPRTKGCHIEGAPLTFIEWGISCPLGFFLYLALFSQCLCQIICQVSFVWWQECTCVPQIRWPASPSHPSQPARPWEFTAVSATSWGPPSCPRRHCQPTGAGNPNAMSPWFLKLLLGFYSTRTGLMVPTVDCLWLPRWLSGLPANAGDTGDLGSIPGSGRYPAGNGSPLCSSCLEHTVDRQAWWATVHGVTKSLIWLIDLLQHSIYTFLLRKLVFQKKLFRESLFFILKPPEAT